MNIINKGISTRQEVPYGKPNISVKAMGMSTFLAVISAVSILLAGFLLFKFKKKWYHFYALGLVIIALIIYL